MKQRTAPPRRLHFWLLASGWTVFVVYGSLVPLLYREVAVADALERFRNLPPLGVGLGTRADLVANILLFIPLTFLWMGVLSLDRGRVATWVSALLLTPLAAAAAVALEFTQIWFAGRTVSRNDILAESVGGCLGVLLWLLAGSRIVAWVRSFAHSRDRRSTLLWLLEAYILGFAIYSVIPLDLTISVSDLYDKFRRGAVLLVPFSYGYDEPATVVYQFFADITTFLPVGAWIALVWRKRFPGRSAFLLGLVGGGAIAIAIEFAQLLVLSRYTDTTDIILGALGAGVGSWWMARGEVRLAGTSTALSGGVPRKVVILWLTVLAAYSLLLVAGFLYPFDWTDDRALLRTRYEGFFRVLFVALYQGSEFNAIKQFLVRFLLFAPLGMIVTRLASLAGSPVTRAVIYATGCGYAALLALAIEAAQIFMPSKIADSTEVLVCWAGIAAGVVVMRRLMRHGPDGAAREAAVAAAPRSSGKREWR